MVHAGITNSSPIAFSHLSYLILFQCLSSLYEYFTVLISFNIKSKFILNNNFNQFVLTLKKFLETNFMKNFKS